MEGVIEAVPLVGEAFEALLVEKNVERHMSYVGDDVVLEELHIGSQAPSVVTGKDEYRRYLAKLPTEAGVAGIEVTLAEWPAEPETVWAKVMVRWRKPGEEEEDTILDLKVAVREAKIRVIQVFPERPRVWRYP